MTSPDKIEHGDIMNPDERPELRAVPHVQKVEPGTELWEKATELEARKFIERNYVASAAELEEEYDEYMPATEMVASVKGEKVVAQARLIDYVEGIGFKTINDAQNPASPLELSEDGWNLISAIDPHDAFEIGTMAGETDSAAELYGLFGGRALDGNPPRHWMLASIDQQALDKALLPLFGEGIHILGPAVDYVGSLTVPIAINVEEGWVNLTVLAELIGNDERYGRVLQRLFEGREMFKGVN